MFIQIAGIMKKITLLLLLSIASNCIAQLAPTKKLFRGLNRTNSQNYRPVLSGDGKYMIYLSDIDQDDKLIKMFETKKAGGDTWTSPEKIDKIINQPHLNLEGGYFISYDGKTMLLTSRKGGGVGLYDIWESKRKGALWSTPTNFGKPLNSSSNDGFPSLSPDGKTIYFSRCDVMTKEKCEGCKIMMAQKGKTLVKEAVELPASINTGNSIAPLILADNETLIYSSNKNGGKGGYDLYLTRFENDQWTTPIALDYVNTSADEKFISIPARGNIAFFSKEMEGYNTLVKALIPKEYKQRNILWIQGKISSNDLSKVKIQLTNTTTGKKITSTPEKNGDFVLILAEGIKYDISVRDVEGTYGFHSRMDDLTSLEKNLREKWNIELHPLTSGDVFKLNTVSFEPYSSTLTDDSKYDLSRLLFLMKKNPSKKFEIGVHLKEYKENDNQEDKDLTESIISKVVEQREIEIIDTIYSDSIMTFNKTTKTEEVEVEKTMYHNDRTAKQAKVILDYFTSKGIPTSQVNVIGYGTKKDKFKSEDNQSIIVETIIK